MMNLFIQHVASVCVGVCLCGGVLIIFFLSDCVGSSDATGRIHTEKQLIDF